jgi:hypothetical protein
MFNIELNSFIFQLCIAQHIALGCSNIPITIGLARTLFVTVLVRDLWKLHVFFLIAGVFRGAGGPGEISGPHSGSQCLPQGQRAQQGHSVLR